MRIVRIITAVLFGATLTVWLLTSVATEMNADRKSPVIKAESDMISLSVKDDEKKLLEGLTASDDKDGNLTDKIILGGRSKFYSPGELEVTYFVFDSSNNVGTYKRKAKYTDYQPLRFSLDQPLVYSVGETVTVIDRLKLTDAIDGDISRKIQIVSSDVVNTEEGIYTLEVEGISEYGEKAKAALFINIVPRKMNSPKISLSSYMVYVNEGDEFKPEAYVDEITLHSGATVSDRSGLKIESQVDTAVPGNYNVLYSYKDKSGYTGYTGMTVVVTGQED